MKKKIVFSVFSIIICAFMLFGCYSSGPDNILNVKGESESADSAPSTGSFTLTLVNNNHLDMSAANENSRIELSEGSNVQLRSETDPEKYITLTNVQIVSTDTSAEDPANYTATVKVSYEGVPCDEYNIYIGLTFLYYEDGVNLKNQYATIDGGSPCSITVTPKAPVILTESLPEGEALMDYSAALEAFSDQAVTWSVSQDTPLPEGLSLDGANGVISGKPVTEGEYEIAFIAANETGGTQQTLKLKINAHEHILGEFIIKDDVHYKECRCGENFERAEHSFKEVIDKQPTYTKVGLKHSVCTVCGYETAAVEIPILEKPQPTATPTPEPSKAPVDEKTDKTKPENINTGANDSVMAYAAVAAVAAALLVLALRKKAE